MTTTTATIINNVTTMPATAPADIPLLLLFKFDRIDKDGDEDGDEDGVIGEGCIVGRFGVGTGFQPILSMKPLQQNLNFEVTDFFFF